MSQVHISTHPLVRSKMTLWRDQATDPKKFRELLREVTTLIGGANATNLEFLPTCVTGARNDLCAQLDINGDVIGTIYSITGTAANAMVDSAATFWTIQRTPIILAPGTIELHCAGSVTGAIAWTVWYYPLEPGAYVAAV